jgi:sec-independent protein translocase protein TatC
MSKTSDGSMTVLEHLSELRLRLILSAVVLLAAAVFSFTRIGWVRSFLTAPLEGLQLIYLSPPEALTANLRLALVAGAVLAAPLLLYQFMAFLFPAFERREKLLAVVTLFGACVLFCSGVFFAYRIAFPFTIKFFLQFASATLDPQFTISEYLSFVISFHLAFGVVFQLPLVTWALGRMGLLSAQFLRRHRKTALLIMLVLAAVITPPDIISQLVMLGPLFFLYELGILMVVISERKRAKALAQQEL